MKVERVVDAEAIEEPLAGGDAVEPEVRPLPERRGSGELGAWRGEVRAIAVVAAGGIAAGAATVVAVSAARSRTAGRVKRGLRRPRARERENIVASRSFLVDVHVLGR